MVDVAIGKLVAACFEPFHQRRDGEFRVPFYVPENGDAVFRMLRVPGPVLMQQAGRREDVIAGETQEFPLRGIDGFVSRLCRPVICSQHENRQREGEFRTQRVDHLQRAVGRTIVDQHDLEAAGHPDLAVVEQQRAAQDLPAVVGDHDDRDVHWGTATACAIGVHNSARTPGSLQTLFDRAAGTIRKTTSPVAGKPAVPG